MTVFEKDGITMIHGDCMDYFATVKEKEFQLCIADPPYGIGFDKENTSMSSGERIDGTKRKMKSWNNPKPKQYSSKTWDNKPDQYYFNAILEKTQKSIVWGGNYFADLLPPSGGWCVWEKGVPDGMSLSQCELAWNNCNNSIRIVKILWAGYKKVEVTDRFHPTQKPIALYKWLLKNYAKEGDRILDPMAGSFSSAIACWDMGFEYVGIEKDKDYYDKAVQRFKNHVAQGRMFEPEPIQGTQESMGI